MVRIYPTSRKERDCCNLKINHPNMYKLCFENTLHIDHVNRSCKDRLPIKLVGRRSKYKIKNWKD